MQNRRDVVGCHSSRNPASEADEMSHVMKLATNECLRGAENHRAQPKMKENTFAAAEQ